MNRLTVPITLVVLHLAASIAEEKQNATGHASLTNDPAIKLGNTIVKRVNEERKQAGLSPVKRNSNLDEIALWYSQSRFTGNIGEVKESFYLLTCAWKASSSGKSIVLNEEMAEKQVSYCLNTPTLRETLLTPEACTAGIGIMHISDTIFCTMLFEAPKNVSEEKLEDNLFMLLNETRAEHTQNTLLRDSLLDDLAKDYATAEFAHTARDASDLAFLMNTSWWVECAGGFVPLNMDFVRAQMARQLQEIKQRDVMLRPEARAVGIGTKILQNRVYIALVFDIMNGTRGDGTPVRLLENPQAQDPSWQELRDFLRHDQTDAHPYIQRGHPDAFVCADFAEMLHNNAEKAGIRAAYVSASFQDGPGHALNAFSINGDIVYVDVTRPSNGFSESADKIAYIEVGKKYGVIHLDAAEDFTYAYFEEYAEQAEQCFQDREAYGKAVEEFNEAIKAYEKQPTLTEYNRLSAAKKKLDTWAVRLIQTEQQLGLTNSCWNPLQPLVGVQDLTIAHSHVHW